MTTTIRVIQAQEIGKKSKTPVTVEWQGERMVRGHSLQAAVKEIVRMSQSLDVVKLNIIGNPSTGKTTIAESIAHLIHKKSMELYKVPFAVKFFSRTELINFEATLKKLEGMNQVLIFDDISFLQATTDKRTIELIKKSFTEIRHLEGGQDVKIITIFNSHYQMAVQKYLRQSDFAFYTSVGSSDFDNVQQVVGKRYGYLLTRFQRIFHMAVTKDKFTFNMDGKKKFFIYPFRKPFAPSLFYNGDTMRVVVFPKREWIDSFCHVCTRTKNVRMKDGMKIEDFAKELNYKFGTQIAKVSVRTKLLLYGMNTYPKTVKQCITYIDKYLTDKLPQLQELADYYGFKDKKTILMKKPDEEHHEIQMP